MRSLGTIVLALCGSALVGSVVAIAIGLIVRGDDSYVAVVMAALAVSVAAVPVFALARLMAKPVDAARRVAKVLIVLVALAAFGIAAIEVGAQGGFAQAYRGIEMASMMLVANVASLLVQWLVFRSDKVAPEPQQTIRFGRQGAASNG